MWSDKQIFNMFSQILNIVDFVSDSFVFIEEYFDTSTSKFDLKGANKSILFG